MLKNLSDVELTEKIKSLAREERKITRHVVEHIAEVERRKLYLKNYSSLFEYLTKEIGYPNGSAQRRIDAARLLLSVPDADVAEQIEKGFLNLSQISKLQMTCRAVSKKDGKKVSPAQKRQVLEKIKNLKESATELVIAQEFQTEIKVASKMKLQRDESIRVELTFTKEEMEIITQAQALLSNKTGGGLKDTLLESAKQVIARKEMTTSNASQATTVEVESQKSLKSITPKLRREVRQTNPVCQFQDPTSQQICGTKFFLEVDHIQPRSKGGDNSPSNLRMLCKNHNIYRYQKNL